jgi:hypothetical protein
MKLQKNFIWILYLFLVAFTLVPAMVGATEAEFFLIDASPSQVRAGETTLLNITLKNLGTEQALRVGVSLDPDDASPIDPIGPVKAQIELAAEGYPSSSFGAVNQAEEIRLTYKIMAKPNASAGTYNVPLKLEWGTASAEKHNQTLYAGITILDMPFASLSIKNIEPEAFSQGEQGYMTITLLNNGQTYVENIELSWSISSSAIKPLKSTEKSFISNLEKGIDVEIPFNIIVSQNATPGIHTLSIDLTYHDSNGNRKSSSYSSALNVLRGIINEIELTISSISLNPGESSEIHFEITNLGSSTVKDVAIVWTTEDNAILPIDKGNRITLKNLEAGAKADLPVNVVAGASYGVYPLTVEVSYYDIFDIKHSNTLAFGVEIGGETAFQVGLQQSSGTSTSFSIGNIGVNPATSVVVSIPQQDGYSVIGQSETFLGNLEPGDFSVASFEIIPRGPVQSGLKVEVSYTGTNGVRQRVTSVVNISGNRSGLGSGAQDFSKATDRNQMFQGMQNRAGSNGGTNYIRIGIGALVAIVLLYLLGKLNRRRKK